MRKEVGGGQGWQFDDLLWCWPSEVLQIAQGKKVSFSKILARKSMYGVYVRNGVCSTLEDSREFEEVWNLYAQEKVTSRKELQGMAVSRGKGRVQGRVRIVRDPLKQENAMQQGEVLVASMTSPEYIVVMRKAAAIVTDYGGMTSHAAIFNP